MEKKLIKKVKLANNLTLELMDCSKRIAGDRSLVSLVARIEVEVKPEYFEGLDMPEDQIKDIQTALGTKVLYQYEKQRNFIDDNQKDQVLEELKSRFLETSLKYLSSPEFPRKLILSKYGK